MKKLLLLLSASVALIVPIASHSMFSRMGQRSLKLASVNRIGLNFASQGSRFGIGKTFRPLGLRFSSYAQGQDNYEILGVSRSASTQDIKKVYLKLALKHHPDMVDFGEKKAAEERFKRIVNAYEALSENKKYQQEEAERQQKWNEEQAELKRKRDQEWAEYEQARAERQQNESVERAERQRQYEQERDERQRTREKERAERQRQYEQEEAEYEQRKSEEFRQNRIYWRIREFEGEIEFHTKQEESLREYITWWGWLHRLEGGGTEGLEWSKRGHHEKVAEYTRSLEQMRSLQ